MAPMSASPSSTPAAAAAAAAVVVGGGMAACLRLRSAAGGSSGGGGGGSGDLLPPPPHPALVGSEAGSFAQATITARLPAILDSMLRDLEADLREAGLLAGSGGGDGGEGDQQVAQVAAGLQELRALRQSMLDNAALERLEVPGAPERTQVLLDSANACVELMTARTQQRTWLGLPWLTVECYMYAAIHAALQRQPALAGRDPFHRQKAVAWAKSAAAAAEMAEEVELLLHTLAPLPSAPGFDPSASEPPASQSSGANSRSGQGAATVSASAASALAARAAALAGMQMALWGNKADLSLLVNAAGLDGLSLSVSASGAEERNEQQPPLSTSSPPPSRVIVDDSDAVWAVMDGLRARRASSASAAAVGPAGAAGGGGGSSERGPVRGQGQGQGQARGDAVNRVDIVLDNSGLELFADLCLADLLMGAGVADQVVLHGKPISWFVSDTLEGDLEDLLRSCEAERPPSDQLPAAAWQPVRRLAARWRSHLAAGRWCWAAHPFWCTPAPFCWMSAVAPDLYADLAGSGLLVLKGDLNYRKLTHDCRWPHTTPFETALQGFHPAPLLALRTLKADVVAGLAPGLSERLSAADRDWLVNGKWGMVQAAV